MGDFFFFFLQCHSFFYMQSMILVHFLADSLVQKGFLLEQLPVFSYQIWCKEILAVGAS